MPVGDASGYPQGTVISSEIIAFSFGPETSRDLHRHCLNISGPIVCRFVLAFEIQTAIHRAPLAASSPVRSTEVGVERGVDRVLMEFWGTAG